MSLSVKVKDTCTPLCAHMRPVPGCFACCADVVRRPLAQAVRRLLPPAQAWPPAGAAPAAHAAAQPAVQAAALSCLAAALGTRAPAAPMLACLGCPDGAAAAAASAAGAPARRSRRTWSAWRGHADLQTPLLDKAPRV